MSLLKRQTDLLNPQILSYSSVQQLQLQTKQFQMLPFFIFTLIALILGILYMQYCRIFGFIFSSMMTKAKIVYRRYRRRAHNIPEHKMSIPTSVTASSKPRTIEGLRQPQYVHRASERWRGHLDRKQRKPIRTQADPEIARKLSSLREILSCGVDYAPIEILDDLSRFANFVFISRTSHRLTLRPSF